MQGAEGADLERKQILEDQCRAASETLFRKRRDLQQLQFENDLHFETNMSMSIFCEEIY